MNKIILSVSQLNVCILLLIVDVSWILNEAGKKNDRKIKQLYAGSNRRQ